MILKLTALVALLSICASPIICTSPDGASRLDLTERTRQLNDAQSVDLRPKVFALATDYDLDLVKADLNFTTAHIDALHDGEQIILLLPDGRNWSLVVDASDRRGGTEFFTTQNSGLVSTFTRRGDSFFGTIATPTGSFRVEGSANGTTIVGHSQISQRTISQAQDFRYVR